MEASVRGVFSAHFKAWSQGRRLPLHHHKAAYALAHCRTPAMGTHVQRCVHGHYETVQFNACRSRSCPRCSSLARERWVVAQQAKLLACDHYHVVFTVPHELLVLFGSHRKLMVDILFRSVRETLMTLLQDGRHLGAEPGLLMALHTWGRNLSHHPHIHCLVSGGGLTVDGQWRATKTAYLVPVRVVKALYRGKFLGLLYDAVDEGALCPAQGQCEQGLRRLFVALAKKDWYVRLKERYAHGQGVMKYLARYVKGGPISDTRVCRVDDTRVTFRYRDQRDGQRQGITLSVGDFMGRLLWHLPEPYQHLVRTAGLYSNRANKKRNACRRQLNQGREAVWAALSWQAYLTRLGHRRNTLCPVCGTPLAVVPRSRQNQNSYKERPAVKVFIHPTDEADIACEPQPP